MPDGAKTCSRCRSIFTCGMAAGENSCWCAALPHIMPLNNDADCLCPDCLRLEIDGHSDAESHDDSANASAGLDFSPRGEETGESGPRSPA